MESLSTAELIEIAMSMRESLDDQFQYWLTITFVVVVGSFIAGHKLNKNLRLVVTSLYLLATALFFIRTMVDGQIFSMYIQAATERGATWFSDYTPILIFIRSAMYLLGALVTLWFLYINGRRDDG